MVEQKLRTVGQRQYTQITVDTVSASRNRNFLRHAARRVAPFLKLSVITTGVLLALLVASSTASATSLAPDVTRDNDEDSASIVRSDLTREEIKFLEDNWLFNPQDQAQLVARSDSIESNRNLFDEMERAPGLFTDSSGEAGSPLQAQLRDEEDDQSFLPSTPPEIQFQEDNWHLGSGALMTEVDEAEKRSFRSLNRAEQRFLEDNWYFHPGE
jgi:hypothetical protein